MENTEKKRSHIVIKRIIGIISVLVFIGLMVWATLKIGMPVIEKYFGSTNVREANTQVFSDLVKDQPIMGRLIFLGIQVLQVFVALIPGEVVEVAAGAVFGPVEGTGLAMLGVAIGSSIIFLLTKLLGRRFVSLFVSDEQIDAKLKFLGNKRKLNTTVFTVFFIPGTPKDILTYVVGLTKMKLHTFLLISLIARIPSILSSTLAGDAINDQNWKKAIIIFAITAVVSIIGLIIYNKVLKKKENAELAAQTEQTEITEAAAAATEQESAEAVEETAEAAVEQTSEEATETVDQTVVEKANVMFDETLTVSDEQEPLLPTE